MDKATLLFIAALGLLGLGAARKPSAPVAAPGGGFTPAARPQGQPIVTPSGASAPDFTPAPAATAVPYQAVQSNPLERYNYLFRVSAALSTSNVNAVLRDAGQAYANKAISFDDYDSISRAVNTRLAELQMPVIVVGTTSRAVLPSVQPGQTIQEQMDAGLIPAAASVPPSGLTPQQARFYPYLDVIPQATANYLASIVGEAFDTEADAAAYYKTGAVATSPAGAFLAGEQPGRPVFCG